MKKSITSLLKGWCAALLCAGLTLPSFAAADADAAFAAQRHDLKLSLRNAPLREVVTAFTQQTVFIRVTLPFFLMLLCYYSFMNKAVIL